MILSFKSVHGVKNTSKNNPVNGIADITMLMLFLQYHVGQGSSLQLTFRSIVMLQRGEKSSYKTLFWINW